MKKLLIIILVALLGAGVYFTVVEGLQIGSVTVLGFQGIKQENDNLNSKMEEVNTLTSITFRQKTTELNSAAKELENAKTEYENRLKYTSEEDRQKVLETEKYELDFLWAKIGAYATEEKVILQLDVTTSSTGLANMKDLSFIATGSYIGITDFIYSLEDDDELGFRIENFKMIPSGSDLQATFLVRNLDINVGNVQNTQQNINNQSTDTTTDTTTNNTENTSE